MDKSKKYCDSPISVKISKNKIMFFGKGDGMTHLPNLKQRLCEVKSMQDKYGIGNKDPSYYVFNSIHMAIDLYKPMRFALMNKYNCQLVTNAWLKYYEIYSYFKLVKTNKLINVFCNAELPGASICALNHYIKTFGGKMSWNASSLLSSESDNQPLGDYYGIYECNKSNWTMNQTNNGDMTSIDNILDLEKRFGNTIDIYSSDAGIDVSGVNSNGESLYNMQEQCDMKIHLGCAIAGLLLLRAGGSIVLKQYTFFEPLSVDLIMIYASLFGEFYIFKPLTSRPYNSEIYLVGKGYNGLSEVVRNKLIDKLDNWNEDVILENVENLRDIHSALKSIYTTQIEYISENIYLYEKFKDKPNELNKQISGLKHYLCNKWIRKFPVRKIDHDEYIKSNKYRNLKI